MPRRIPDERIFTAALETIATRGYAGATTRQIAAAAGINEVTLFRRFGSKVKLLRAALSADSERFTTGGGPDYTGDLRADLLRIVTLYTEIITRRGRLLPIMLAVLPHDEELREVIDQPQAIIRAVAATLERYQHEGQLQPEPPLQAVAALLGPLLVASMLAPLDVETRPSIPDPERLVDRYLGGRAAPCR